MSHHRGRRRSRIGALTILVLVTAACSGATTDIQSNTPRVRSSARELRPGLLTARDVAKVPGLPELERVPENEAELFENPDPRAPCGAPIDQPDLSRGATAVFASSAFTLSDTVVALSEDAARSYLDANLADATPGCGPYRSRTNQGFTQTVTPTIVDIPPVGDQRVGQRGRIDVQDQILYIGAVLIRRGDKIVFSLVISAKPIRDDTVQALAQRIDEAAARLS